MHATFAARASSKLFDLRGEQIARAPSGFDQTRVARIVLELTPEPRDLRADAAIEHGIGVATLHALEQLIARQHDMRMIQEDREQRVLRRGERNRDAVLADQRSLWPVQDPAAEAQPRARA